MPQGLQMFEGGCAGEAFGGTPQQSRSTKVNERPINQLVTLSLNLEQRVDRDEMIYTQLCTINSQEGKFKLEDLQL